MNKKFLLKLLNFRWILDIQCTIYGLYKGAWIYEYLLLCLNRRELLFNAIQKFWENNRPEKKENLNQTES